MAISQLVGASPASYGYRRIHALLKRHGLAEAFFGSFKRDYVYQACLETLEKVAHQVPAWIEHYNQHAPHSALGMRSPVEFYAEWRVKNKTRPVQN